MKLSVSVVLVLVAFGAANAEAYLKGSKIYDIYPSSESQFAAVNSLELSSYGVDILQHPSKLGRMGKVLVHAHYQVSFELYMKSAGVPFLVAVEDLEPVIENERHTNDLAKMTAAKAGTKIDFTAYYRHSEINAYLDDLAVKYPKLVTIVTRKSYEGRDLKAIVISTTGGADKSKPVIVSDAGIHAREWIAPAVALFNINKLLENVTESDLVDKIDWVIVPVANPDGYEYTHTTDRLWRKTRSPTSSVLCTGVDGNRNFDFVWNGPGSSSTPCSTTYAGPSAFSEVETQFLRDLLEEYKGRTQAVISIHSYGYYFIYPYGYSALPTANDAEMASVGRKVADAIDAAALPGSPKYTVGNSGAVLYVTSGATNDYAYEIGKARLAYTLELPGQGFDLPPSNISQIVKETWQGFIALGRHIIETQK